MSIREANRLRVRSWRGVWLRADASVFRQSATDEPLEYQVKAAFLLNFTKFVEWPADGIRRRRIRRSPSASWGSDPFGSALDQIVAEEVVRRTKGSCPENQRAPPPAKPARRCLSTGLEKDVLEMLSEAGAGSPDDRRRREFRPRRRHDRFRG